MTWPFKCNNIRQALYRTFNILPAMKIVCPILLWQLHAAYKDLYPVYMLKHLNMNQNCISKQILDLIQNQQKNQIQCVFFSRPFLSPCYSSLRPFSKPCPFKGHFMLKPFICKIFANIVVLYWYLSKTVLGTINSSQITKKRQPSSLIDFCAIKMIDWFMCHKNVSWTLESSSTQCI